MIKTVLKKIPGSRWVARKLGVIPSQGAGNRQFLLDMLPKKAVGAEIGVHLGNFSSQLLNATSPTELHLVDPWEYHGGAVYENAWYGGQSSQTELDERHAIVLNRFERNIRSGQVQIHRGYSEEVLQEFPDSYFDWIYIDGDHTYENAKKDIELSIQKVKPGGYITGDDYAEGGWFKAGVKRAVDELADTEALQLIKLQNRQFIFVVNNPA
jgi:Methyltransferase domain